LCSSSTDHQPPTTNHQPPTTNHHHITLSQPIKKGKAGSMAPPIMLAQLVGTTGAYKCCHRKGRSSDSIAERTYINLSPKKEQNKLSVSQWHHRHHRHHHHLVVVVVVVVLTD